MKIVVQVQPEAVDELIKGRSTDAGVAALLRACQHHRLRLMPMHPGVDDAELRTYFDGEVPSTVDAPALAEVLRGFKPVQAAYPKPQDELP